MTFADAEFYPPVSVCQPVEEALRQQVEQERLLNQVTTQIRQSLELPVILETAVQQVRDFLLADRLVIYQFDTQSSTPSTETSPGIANCAGQSREIEGLGGQVTYEARASQGIITALHWAEPDSCFVRVPLCRERYHRGSTLAIADTELTYANVPCLMNLLRQLQVRAKLVAPIMVQESLWGLLIAHQCFEPREWQPTEQRFLQHIAEHLAIAIYQAQLYAQVQQQKQTLEQRVIERTQDLRDTLLAAQAANRAKSEFLANMSHELRTPLTCVIGMSATLLQWSLGQLSQRQRDFLQTIHNSGKHLLELINDILDLSQVEAGKMLLNVSEFSLTQLAYQSLQILKEKAERNQVTLALEIQSQRFEIDAPEPPPTLNFAADQRRVRQILLNLLSNAIKFTPEGGQVILRLWSETNKVALQIEDTGIGIPEDQKTPAVSKISAARYLP
ncbi:GAF domain-containing sensor histidine kinase [Neosynechococcus sphagnicola]|uniref:sensor histidine kinase n=1 Tax=Neosynechococcus sphagnicola TaxID=1501145 RepID=UPI00068AB145|nr:histidine kinase dimerization/phospho-acceptor domain-containing protein [Neosynechococcus sphagnicola]